MDRSKPAAAAAGGPALKLPAESLTAAAGTAAPGADIEQRRQLKIVVVPHAHEALAVPDGRLEAHEGGVWGTLGPKKWFQ